jgi:hypothetical protein
MALGGKMNHSIAEMNVLMITLDSLNANVALSVKLPNLSTLGTARLAETHGSYTLPAHVSLLVHGNLPTPIDGKGKILGLDRVWRSSESRGRRLKIGQVFHSLSLPQYYANLGHKVTGIGGVGFFDPAVETNFLPRLFPHYQFPDVVTEDGWAADITIDSVSKRYREGQSLPVTSRHGLLSSLCSETDPWFVFCNVAETHFPYNTPGYELTASSVSLLEEAWNAYTDKTPGSCKLSNRKLAKLKSMQREALINFDEVFGKIIGSLPSNQKTLVIVTADHGEEFGEYGRLGHGHASPAVWQVPLWVNVL